MTAHDPATGTSWAVIDRPYNSDASRLFFSMWAHSKFLKIRRSAITPSPPTFAKFASLAADFPIRVIFGCGFAGSLTREEPLAYGSAQRLRLKSQILAWDGGSDNG